MKAPEFIICVSAFSPLATPSSASITGDDAGRHWIDAEVGSKTISTPVVGPVNTAGLPAHGSLCTSNCVPTATGSREQRTWQMDTAYLRYRPACAPREDDSPHFFMSTLANESVAVTHRFTTSGSCADTTPEKPLRVPLLRLCLSRREELQLPWAPAAGCTSTAGDDVTHLVKSLREDAITVVLEMYYCGEVSFKRTVLQLHTGLRGKLRSVEEGVSVSLSPLVPGMEPRETTPFRPVSLDASDAAVDSDEPIVFTASTRELQHCYYWLRLQLETAESPPLLLPIPLQPLYSTSFSDASAVVTACSYTAYHASGVWATLSLSFNVSSLIQFDALLLAYSADNASLPITSEPTTVVALRLPFDAPLRASSSDDVSKSTGEKRLQPSLVSRNLLETANDPSRCSQDPLFSLHDTSTRRSSGCLSHLHTSPATEPSTTLPCAPLEALDTRTLLETLYNDVRPTPEQFDRTAVFTAVDDYTVAVEEVRAVELGRILGGFVSHPRAMVSPSRPKRLRRVYRQTAVEPLLLPGGCYFPPNCQAAAVLLLDAAVEAVQIQQRDTLTGWPAGTCPFPNADEETSWDEYDVSGAMEIPMSPSHALPATSSPLQEPQERTGSVSPTSPFVDTALCDSVATTQPMQSSANNSAAPPDLDFVLRTSRSTAPASSPGPSSGAYSGSPATAPSYLIAALPVSPERQVWAASAAPKRAPSPPPVAVPEASRFKSQNEAATQALTFYSSPGNSFKRSRWLNAQGRPASPRRQIRFPPNE